MLTKSGISWNHPLDPEQRKRLLKQTREALDANPATRLSSADIPSSISDNDLILHWIRA